MHGPPDMHYRQPGSNQNFNTTENNKRESPSIYDLQNKHFIIDEKKEPLVLRKQDVNLKKSLANQQNKS